jgi:integrase
MKLTDAVLRQTKPTGKLKKLSDGGGLQLWIYPDGAKRWRMAFRFAGKQKTFAIGVYPDVGLKDAREAAADARGKVAAGQNPVQARRAERQQAATALALTFTAIAEEYIAKCRQEGRAASTIDKQEYFLGKVASRLGKLPIAEITAADIIAAVRPVQIEGNHHTALRCLRFIRRVHQFAVATARLASDPGRDIRAQDALTIPKTRNRAAITRADDFGKLLRAIDGYESGYPATRIALKLLALTFVRPGELRLAEWSEFNLDRSVWVIPPGRTKMRKEHVVPLSSQGVDLLRELQALTGKGKLLFPGERSRSKPISENTLNGALRRMGFGKDQMTSHGFRATASTLLNESGLWSADAIEKALAHGDADEVRGVYHRGQHWAERVKMASWWADEIDRLRGLECLHGAEAKVLPLAGRRSA